MKINLVTFQNITKNNSGTINSNQHLLYKQEYDSVSFSGKKPSCVDEAADFNGELAHFVFDKQPDKSNEDLYHELQDELYLDESRDNYKKNKKNLAELRKNFPKLSSITGDDDETFKKILYNLYEKLNKSAFQNLILYRGLMKALDEAQADIEERRRITKVRPETLQIIVDI